MRPLVLDLPALLLLGALSASAQTPPGPGVRFQEPFPSFAPDGRPLRWYKGNTHTHTINSDGDSEPEVVVTWYRTHGYDFLVLSDHNVFTDPATLSALTDSTFLLLPGEEVTSSFAERPVHVNGLNVRGLVEPRKGNSLVETIQANVDAVRDADGIPHINHPNFRWAFGAQELARVRNDRLLEIFNGHPFVHNLGGGDFPGMERIWDLLLTGGKRMYGIAVDDAHHFQGEFAPDRSNPGRGWVVVRIPELDSFEIVRALEAGHFYASTGVELDDVVVQDGSIEIRIRQQADFRYTTEFVADYGVVVATTGANPATFALDGPWTFVRARVIRSDGATAWIQPVFTSPVQNP